jgi:hypothetical protein
VTDDTMASAIFVAGLAKASILVASALVPSTLRWREELRPMPVLHRQMHWVYAGYVLLSIVAFAVISLQHSAELAAGGGLARAVCGYIAVFWGVRLGLQAVFDFTPYAPHWWQRAGLLALTLLFTGITGVYAVAAVRPLG